MNNDDYANDSNSIEKSYMLTTIDNPFDPFEQFIPWFMYDTQKGYNTCSTLARVANITDDMSQEEQIRETNRAIDEIIQFDFLDIYQKVEPKRII